MTSEQHTHTPEHRLKRLHERLGGIAYGGDYNPEQWPREMWDEDVRLMKEAGVNLVTLAVFSWSRLETADGVYDFGWLDEIMDLLHANGIGVDLATPDAVPPAWLVARHPDILPVLADGSTFGFGSRQHFDVSHPAYRAKSLAMAEKMGERYAAHPALCMWHVNNEYGPVSYGPHADRAFREWLQAKYGSLEELNRAWSTDVWGQVYSDWAQVNAPAQPRPWSNPSRRLDYHRFTSDSMLAHYKAERDILRRHTPDLPVVTNFMRFYRNADYWRWAPEEDAVALDIYPDPSQADSHIAAAFHFDLFRSLKGGEPWLLMEQSSSAVSQWKLNVVKEPGRMRLGSLQALGRGADSVMFFQWRASRGGQERFHSAMLPHSGPDSRTFREIVALGEELRRLAPVAGTRSASDIAVLFDWNGWWGLEDTFGLPRNDFSYPDTVMRHYTPLWKSHYPVDVVGSGSDFSGYTVLVVPNAYLIDDEGVRGITEFVRGGGTLVMSFFSGVVDASNRVRENGYPGAFRELIGAKIDEYWAARPHETFDVRFEDGRTATSTWWREDLHLETGTAKAVYEGGLLDGRAAVVENRFGEGRVVYVSTLLDEESFSEVLLEAVEAADVPRHFADVPADVDCSVRRDDTHDYVFLLNHNGDDEAVVPISGTGTDLLTGDTVRGGVTLSPLGAAVIRRQR